MDIVIGSDHAGFAAEEQTKRYLTEQGVRVIDKGCFSEDSVHYPQFAAAVAGAVSRHEFERGILICGTGIGMSIAANKFPGVRAALCHNAFTARACREHNNANVLCMGARVLTWEQMEEILELWLHTDFAGGRHETRVAMLETLNGYLPTVGANGERLSWDEYLMGIAHLVKTRSTCLRRQVGAVAASPEHRILGTGYNGPLPGARHCDEVGCLREKLGVPSGQRQEICRAQHAEANVCNFAARYGYALDGATMYVTAQPCTTCVKAMVTSGVKRVVFDSDYPDELACQLAAEAGMELIRYRDLIGQKD